MSESIRGYRVQADRPKEPKSTNPDYLRLRPEASHALRDLRLKVIDKGANCVDDDRFTADPLPSDEEAREMCFACPAFRQCEIYREVAKPAYGVYASEVRGRSLEERNFDEGS